MNGSESDRCEQGQCEWVTNNTITKDILDTDKHWAYCVIMTDNGSRPSRSGS